jgi:hypothetical protein
MVSRLAVAFVLLASLALAPGFAVAQEEAPSLEQVLAETADTPAEHAALAGYYRGKADEARALARRHKSMGHAYVGGKSAQKQHFQNHCRKITEQQEKIAQEYDAMAKLHDEEAKKK